MPETTVPGTGTLGGAESPSGAATSASSDHSDRLAAEVYAFITRLNEEVGRFEAETARLEATIRQLQDDNKRLDDLVDWFHTLSVRRLDSSGRYQDELCEEIELLKAENRELWTRIEEKA
jgi:predicted RNase H-like nuclease (RuvC/YqgF family)